MSFPHGSSVVPTSPSASHLSSEPAPPPYELEQGLSQDSRNSSTLSLAPQPGEAEATGRRKLLIVYIHGFYGSDQSFRAFPYHIHHALKDALRETHVIHSKLYPRYKTYRAIDLARDKFSAWLEPHESANTDVILVGHSMGGILAADVVLIPQKDPSQKALHSFKHRILGTVSLDSPFLGLHPGIIASGISSLFQPTPQPSDQSTTPLADESTPTSPQPFESPSSAASISGDGSVAGDNPVFQQRGDASFNPSFFNDDPFPEQPFLKGVMKFVSKHKSDGIIQAFGDHVKFHFEFGGAVANYPDLIRRYRKIRLLEDEPRGTSNAARVRFVNYYTISSKGQASPTSEDTTSGAASTPQEDQITADHDPTCETTSSPLKELKPQDSRNSVETSGKESPAVPQDDLLSQGSPPPLPMQTLQPRPLQEDEAALPSTESNELHPSFPPRPQVPEKPVLPEVNPSADKDARKAAEKETKALQKGYETALKQYHKAVEEREKTIQKHERKQAKEFARHEKETLKEQERYEKDFVKRMKQEEKQLLKEAKQVESDRRKTKYKKFCTLPGKIDGKPDPTWVDIYMEGVDEVGAHCGLFAKGPHYLKLVKDVVARVKGWVDDEAARRGDHTTSA